MIAWLSIAVTCSASTSPRRRNSGTHASIPAEPTSPRDERRRADPTRLMLAAALAAGGELCVCDLAWIAERAQNLVSHHLRVLRAAGLVSARRDGKMVMYSLSDAGRLLLDGVLADELVR